MFILINVNNIVYLCKICHVNVTKKDFAAQRDLRQSWVHMKCYKLNHIDYKYLQGSNDLCYCLSCCSKIFRFGTLATNVSIFSITNSFSQVTNSDHNEESLLLLKPPSDLALLYNQFSNTSPEENNDPENVVNSK